MRYYLSCFLAVMITTATAQTIPDLPTPRGAGPAEVWHDDVYFFGGSNTWGGRDKLYPLVTRYDGLNWSEMDSIPDSNVWGITSVLIGSEVFLLGGWPAGASLLRKLDLSNGTWTYLTPSPNSATWGIAAEQVNGSIYLFNDTGSVYVYDTSGDSWSIGTKNSTTAFRALSSTVWEEEIYLIGFRDSDFYKYSPANDSWTQLADTPYPVAACAMGLLNGMLYCVGGSEQGSNSDAYRSVLAYDPVGDAWSVDQVQIADKRTWMAAVAYRGGLYVLGGFDSTGAAVDIFEEIMPMGPTSVSSREIVPSAFSLSQNYPNPFNPETTITYTLPKSARVKISIFNALGQQVRTFRQGVQPAGHYQVQWDGRNTASQSVSSGIYIYELDAGEFKEVRKMLLLR